MTKNTFDTIACLTLVVALVGFAGCESTPPTVTPSGKPEVRFDTKSFAEVRGILVTFFTGRGYFDKSIEPDKLVFDRPDTRLKGTSRVPFCSRIRISLVAADKGGIRVIATPHKVTNCGVPPEEEQMDFGGYPQIQDILEEMKRQALSVK